jgi:hypothetical protein
MKHHFTRLPQADLAALYSAEAALTLNNRPLNASILSASILRRDQVEIAWLDDPFFLDAELEDLKRPFIEYLVRQGSQQPTNNRTVRLRDLEQLDQHRIQLTFQSASYFDYMVTNWASSQDYAVARDDGPVTSFRNLVEPGPKLKPLPRAKAANQTGVVCLFLCESCLLVNQRGRQITDSGLWGLSASGTLHNDGYATSPFDHVLTELAEETGLEGDFVDADSLRLIGIAREFHRAGKPEMYFVVRGRRSLVETQERVSRRLGADAWEAVRSDWLALASPAQLATLQDHRLQPSAQIGLWFLAQLLRAGSDWGTAP